MLTRRISASALAALLVVAACGDDDGGDASETGDTPEETPAPDETSESPDDTDGAATTTGEDTGTTSDIATTVAGTDPTAEDACEATEPGTQLEYGVFAPGTHIDPIQSSGALVGGTELAAVYDVLFTYDYDNNEYMPHLAESLTPNDDYTEWTLKLREGITYSDGTPLTAELVSENMDRFFQEDVRNTSAGFLAPIVDKQVVDDVTLEMTLESPWVEFPFVFSDEPGMIVNTNAIGDDLEAFANQPPDAAGLGPYVVERNVPGEELVLTARDDYWGGRVCIETLRFTFVPGAQPTYDAFTNDELDVAFLRDPAVIEQSRQNGDDSIWIQQDSGSTLLINHAEERPGVDPRVREAIWLALDVEVINERAYQGALNTGKSLIQEGSRFYSDAIETIPTDTDRARQLLDEAKADGYDGALTLLCSNSPPAPEVALASQGSLEAVGFNVTVENMPTNDQIGQVVQGNFDVSCWGSGMGPETGLTGAVRSLHSESEVNRQSYANDEMDAALDDLLAAETDEDLQAAMAAVNNLYVEDAVTASIGALEEGVVWQPRVEGIVPTTSTIMLFHDAHLTGDG